MIFKVILCCAIVALPTVVADAQPDIIPLTAQYYAYGDTSDIHFPWCANIKDSVGAEMKPFSSISFALPKQPMTEKDGVTRISADGYYHDSIGVWMSCPPGYTVTVATSWSTSDHFAVGTFVGPLPYGLYWSPFHSSPYIDREYGGVLYATVEVHQSHGNTAHFYSAIVDEACFKYWRGSLSVDTIATVDTTAKTYYDILGRSCAPSNTVKPLGHNRFLVIP